MPRPAVRLQDTAGADAALASLPAIRVGFGSTLFPRCVPRLSAAAAPLSAEDQVVQSMPDASPIKWHRAHVTWFFEQFLLRPFAPAYRPFDERFAFLFNSYYVAAGPRHARPQRGLITRPGVTETTAYRAHVDAAVAGLIEATDDFGAVRPIVEIGLHHEQQHQELLLTDILHAFAQNATHPAYDTEWQWPQSRLPPRRRTGRSAGIHTIGHQGNSFSFDNEVSGASGAAPAGARRPRARDQRRVARIHGRRRLHDSHRSGCRTAGTRRRRRVIARPVIGGTSTAPGSR